ncbi:unnamed protein product [Adineta ricciae]|uniref:Inositol polyphosphate-related phosphatase domain-containing protein n=1 Tax=Adineta ricciae TaxID=249248 RepID=A0A813S1F6_ADIRI|nr:unnamed protein product [Adineta ricciae]
MTRSSSELSILIGSFNTHRIYPPSDIDLSSWLTFPLITPRIIAVGLQELPLNLTFSQQKSEHQWLKLIERTLPNHRLLSHVRLNGTILFIYVQSSYLDQCSSVGSSTVPTGFMNIYGNKGSVGIRFNFQQTPLCFLNCHLSAGEDLHAFQLRNKQFSLIHQRTLFKSSCRQLRWNIHEHHGIFFFGDLNYRQTENEKDELNDKTDILKTYTELPIKFSPTYKYHLNSNAYNLLRRPSWTDRILYRNNQCRIHPIDYWTASMIRFSDHRPIAKLFSLSRLIH